MRKIQHRRGVAQQTLDAATPENVEQMQRVLTTLLQQHSQAASHRRSDGWFILDVDLTGIPCGKQAEKSVKGYFHQERPRRGRQQGRVLASQYGEIIVDELYPGNTNLSPQIPSLIAQAEQALNWIPWKHKHTLIRIDAGGGSVATLNHLLDQGYAVVSKEYSSCKASLLIKSVKEWVQDPSRPERQLGWVQEETYEYGQPVKRLGIRWKGEKGTWRSCVLLFARLTDRDILSLVGEPRQSDAAAIIRAYAHFYDRLRRRHRNQLR